MIQARSLGHFASPKDINRHEPSSFNIDHNPQATPFQWESFTAVLNGDSVSLKWIVSNEISHPTFFVERSTDGGFFHPIDTIHKSSEIGIVDDMAFTDHHPGPGIHQYRIKQFGVSGQPLYSQVRTIVIIPEEQVNFWPNPSKGIIYYNNKIASGNLLPEVSIYTTAGRLIKKMQLVPGSNRLVISELEEGMYIFHVKLPNEDPVNKIILVRQ
jgi:hypothetical protein